MKKITVITGHYGSGKTNFSANLALRTAAEGHSSAVVDLDIVNPYFRTADFKELFGSKGIKLIAPDFANSNLDVPSLQFDIEQLASSEEHLIIDVGGDDAGAYALGRFSEALNAFGNELDMLYVINQRRYLTQSAEEAASLMYEIETASRMKHTAIVNNTNLGCETVFETVEASRSFADAVSAKTGLPVIYTVYPENCAELSDKPDVFAAKRYVKSIWD